MPNLDKRLGPFTGKQWVVGFGGGAVVYLGWRWWKNRQAGAAGAASTAAVGGGGSDGSSGAGGGGGVSLGASTLAQWEQAILQTGGIAAYNAATNWLSGNCVDQSGYAGLVSALGTLGLPPGISAGPLSVCSGGNQGQSSSPAQGGASSTTTTGNGQSNSPPPGIPVGPSGVAAPGYGSGYDFVPTGVDANGNPTGHFVPVSGPAGSAGPPVGSPSVFIAPRSGLDPTLVAYYADPLGGYTTAPNPGGAPSLDPTAKLTTLPDGSKVLSH